jgi:hypothetical protein
MNSPAVVATLASISWFGVLLLLEAFTNRLCGGGVVWLLRNFAACAASLFVTLLLLVPDRVGVLGMLLAFAFGGLAFACLFVLYVPFLYTVRTSLSVQSIVFLLDHDGRVPKARLTAYFTSEDIVAARIATLVKSGYLASQVGGFRLTRRGRLVASVFARIKAWWALGAGG